MRADICWFSIGILCFQLQVKSFADDIMRPQRTIQLTDRSMETVRSLRPCHMAHVSILNIKFRDEIPLTEKVLTSFTKSVPLGAVMIVFGILSSIFRLWYGIHEFKIDIQTFKFDVRRSRILCLLIHTWFIHGQRKADFMLHFGCMCCQWTGHQYSNQLCTGPRVTQ